MTGTFLIEIEHHCFRNVLASLSIKGFPSIDRFG